MFYTLGKNPARIHTIHKTFMQWGIYTCTITCNHCFRGTKMKLKEEKMNIKSQMQCLWDVIQSDSTLQRRRKTCNWLGISEIFFFFQAITLYPLHYLQYYHYRVKEHIWHKVIWLKSSDNPEWQSKGGWAKRPVGIHLDKISRTEWRDKKHCLAAQCYSKWQPQCSNFGLLGRQIL